MTKYKFGVLVGVSTDKQAGEQPSIPDQIKTCRETIEFWRGEEVDVFTMDGYSRTGYDGLNEAMEDIPPLKDAVEAATKNKINVLIFDHSDRLGDLAKMIHNRFKKIRKQIYSAKESARLQDPDKYDPYDDEATDNMINQQMSKQTYRINKLRRGWNVGVNNRIEKGLHPLSLPFGYRLTGKDQPAAQVPSECELLIQFKDWTLAGIPYEEIARRADRSGTRPRKAPRWKRQVIVQMMANPFYAGIVRLGKYRHKSIAPKSEWKLGKGKHEALWDEDTHYALLSENKRRLDGKRNYNAKYPYSGLTVCGVCGVKISRHGNIPWEYLYCSTTAAHWSMHYQKAEPLLTEVVMSQYKQYRAAPPKPTDFEALYQKRDEHKTMRADIQRAWKKGVFNDEEAAKEINALDDMIETIERKIEKEKEEERSRVQWVSQLGEMESKMKNLPLSIQQDPAGTNLFLSQLIDKIVLEGEHATVHWRE